MKSQQQEDKKENKSTFGIVIYDTLEGSEDIDEAIESAIDLDYPPEKVKIVICCYPNRNTHKLISTANNTPNVMLVANLQSDNESTIDHAAFSNTMGCENLIKLTHDSHIPKDTLKKIDEHINKAETKFFVFSNKSKNKKAIVSLPFKAVSSQYLNYNNFDLMSKEIVSATKKLGKFKDLDEK